MLLRDLNRDGKLDLVFANYVSNYVSARLGTGTGSFQSEIAVGLQAGDGQFWVDVADVNGDTRPDLVVANYDGNTVKVFLSSNGSFSGEVYTVSQVAPRVMSIDRAGPSSTVDATSVSYTVTFSEDVIGVDPTDFTVVRGGRPVRRCFKSSRQHFNLHGDHRRYYRQRHAQLEPD